MPPHLVHLRVQYSAPARPGTERAFALCPAARGPRVQQVHARLVVLKERNQEFWDFIEATFKQKLQGEQLQRALNRLPGYRAGVFSIVFFEDTAVADKQLASGMPAEVVKNFAAQALGIVQANVWNAIAAAGLATSNQHMNLQMEAELHEFLNVPASWKSYSVFPVGYPDEVPAEGSRHDAKDIIFFEHGPSA